MNVSNSQRFRRIVELEIKELNKVQNKSIEENKVKVIRNECWTEEQDIKKFDPNDYLDEKYQVKSAGSHFYKIGLSLIKFAENDQRIQYHSIYSNLIWISIIIIRCTVSMLIPVQSGDAIRVYLGDFAYFLNSVYHLNPCNILMFFTSIDSMIINVLDYNRGKRQTFLQPFGLLSGRCSPLSVGLDNEQDIIKMAKIFKFGIKMMKSISINIMIISTLISFLPLVFSLKWYELILFGLPWSLIYSIALYFGLKIFTYQILYFSITCFYFKVKLKQINNAFREKTKFKSRRFSEILNLIKKLNAIYNEIDEFNSNYWSKISLSYIRSLGLVFNLMIFVSIYGSLNIFLQIVFTYFGISFFLQFMFYLKINALVSSEAFKAYRTVNNLYLEYNEFNIPILLNFKVLVRIDFSRINSFLTLNYFI